MASTICTEYESATAKQTKVRCVRASAVFMHRGYRARRWHTLERLLPISRLCQLLIFCQESVIVASFITVSRKQRETPNLDIKKLLKGQTKQHLAIVWIIWSNIGKHKDMYTKRTWVMEKKTRGHFPTTNQFNKWNPTEINSIWNLPSTTTYTPSSFVKLKISMIRKEFEDTYQVEGTSQQVH